MALNGTVGVDDAGRCTGDERALEANGVGAAPAEVAADGPAFERALFGEGVRGEAIEGVLAVAMRRGALDGTLVEVNFFRSGGLLLEVERVGFAWRCLF